MSWARLDDSFHDHPKVDGLSLSAVGLYTLCLTWAHRHRKTAATPGHITRARATKVGGRRTLALTKELVDARLWDTVPNVDGWVIHDFTDYLPRERDPQERASAGRKGAAKRWESDGKLPSTTHEVAMQDDGKTMAEGMASDGSGASAPAFPSRPVPSKEQDPPSPPRGGSKTPRRKPRTETPDQLLITPTMSEWGKENAPDVTDPEQETRKMLDHHRAKGSLMADWVQAWRTWMGNAQTYATERKAGGTKRPADVHPHDEWMYSDR